MKIVLANYPPSMISYSTFDAGPKKQAGTSILLQFELVRSGGVEPGTPSFLTERASSLAPSNRLCQQQAPSRDSDDLENWIPRVSNRVAKNNAITSIFSGENKAKSHLHHMDSLHDQRRIWNMQVQRKAMVCPSPILEYASRNHSAFNACPAPMRQSLVCKSYASVSWIKPRQHSRLHQKRTLQVADERQSKWPVQARSLLQVTSRSPGKASSYLYAMKGEARRRRLKCLAPYGIRADPPRNRESYRFHHRDK